MSLKNRVVSKIAEKTAQTGLVSKAINKLSEKSAAAMGIKSVSAYSKKSDKKYMVFKRPSSTLGELALALIDPYDAIEKFGSLYKFCDLNGKELYISDFDTGLYIERDVVTLYDSNRVKYGKVKEHLISMGMPLFESKVKKCSVTYDKKTLCKIKKYKSLGSLFFDTLEGEIRISCNDEEKQEFVIERNDNKIAKVNGLPLSLVNGLADHYLIEYDNVDDEKIITLMVVALYIVMNSD